MIFNATTNVLPGLPPPLTFVEPHRLEWGGDNKHTPDPAAFASKLTLLPNTPAVHVLSVEDLRHPDHPQPKTIRAILRAYAAWAPHVKVLVYDPSLRFDPTIPGTEARTVKEIKRRRASSVEREILALTDIFVWDQYIMAINKGPATAQVVDHDRTADWTAEYLASNRKAATGLGRPVACSVWHKYAPGNGVDGKPRMTTERFSMMVRDALDLWGSVVWWNEPVWTGTAWVWEPVESLGDYVKAVTTGD